MKHYHCIHCGAPVQGSAAAFCPECKKPLRKPSKNKRPVPAKPKRPPRSSIKPANRPPQAKKTRRKKRKAWLDIILKPPKNKKTDVENTPVKNPMDEDYDGYYDDKPTDDNRQDKENLDPELIKRVVIISCGAAALIILAIILLNLL